MLKLFAGIQADLAAFLMQRDRVAMVVACADGDVPLYLKTLEAIEQADSPHAYWSFAQPFETPEQYVREIVATVRARVTRLSELLANEPDGPGLPPPFPSELAGTQFEPAELLRRVVQYTRTVHGDPGSLVVWSLFPTSISDGARYARFMGAVLEHEWPAPWCYKARLFVRESSTDARLSRHFRGVPRLGFYTRDLSSPALEASLVEQALDEGVALPLRMQAYLMLANLDLAHKRLPKAMTKFTTLVTYYRNTRQPGLIALAINGMGEVCARGGAVAQAQSLFESALTPAIEAEAEGYAVLINVSLNLGNLHLSQRRYPEAIGYYRAVADMAGALRNALLKIQCLESIGTCELAQGAHKNAWEAWIEGMTLARGIEADLPQERLLERLRDLYRGLHMSQEQYRAEAELKVLRERGPAALRPLVEAKRG